MKGPAASRARLLAWGVLALLLAGCATAPGVRGPALDASSALLAVEVHFPVPRGRDPELVDALFVKEPVPRDERALASAGVPASFVKGARAYLVDPAPGTWSLLAVRHVHAPPLRPGPVQGVSHTVASEGDLGTLVVLPAEWIRRTRTAVAAGGLAFMGSLSVRDGGRVDADTRFDDPLQERLVRALRPGATGRSGFAARLSRTRTLDPTHSALRRGEARDPAFLETARRDLAGSTWAAWVAAPEAEPASVAVEGTPTAPEPTALEAAASGPSAVPGEAATPGPSTVPGEAAASGPSAVPGEAATPGPSAVPGEAAASGPSAVPGEAATPGPSVVPGEAATPGPVALPATSGREPPEAPGVAVPRPLEASPAPPPETSLVDPPPQASPAPPPETSLVDPPPQASPAPPPELEVAAQPDARPGSLIQLGMSHEEVRRILGEPDDRSTRMTARALIPFATAADARRRVWTYRGRGRVEFSLDRRTGALRVVRVEGLAAD